MLFSDSRIEFFNCQKLGELIEKYERKGKYYVSSIIALQKYQEVPEEVVKKELNELKWIKIEYPLILEELDIRRYTEI